MITAFARTRIRTFAVAATALMTATAIGQTTTESESIDSAPIALSGYDPLSYADGTPALGDAAHRVRYEGSEYRFVSSENAMRFEMSPAEFAPVFGGADPVRLAGGAVVEPNPLVFSVIEGGLFLFESESNRERWLREFDTLAPSALRHWDTGGDTAPALAINAALDRNAGEHLKKKGFGAGGHDPVAYFPEGGAKPTKGNKKFQAEYRGVTYRFASAKNREKFLARPSRYEPAYGGWCAYAIAHEDYTKPNPKRFLIQNDRLLLFYDGIGGDTYKRWHKEGPTKLEGLADVWWESETGETP